MSPGTRKAAIEKLEAFHHQNRLSGQMARLLRLENRSRPVCRQCFSFHAIENARDLAKIGKPVDRGEWGETPPTVDAYDNPQLNEIVFPAGILQPPFYDPKRDDAYNMAASGQSSGTKSRMAFDDQGAQFDPRGNLKNWWTPEDLKSFQERGECVVKQFDGYEVEKGLHENGKLVEGESIADLGGSETCVRSVPEIATWKIWVKKTRMASRPSNGFFLATRKIGPSMFGPSSRACKPTLIRTRCQSFERMGRF